MGEQYITLSVSSENPIDWQVGDFCEFRGEVFTLNYIPAATQKAGVGERGDAFVYENIKFDSYGEELTRPIMLDITSTTGEYAPALGTNYTGSSQFSLFCGEVEVNGVVLTPVCALAAKIQVNLDRAFPRLGWKIFVDTTTTYTDNLGREVLVTHTDDKTISFNKTTIAQALAEVNKTFDLDYCVRGRNIYIGYTLGNVTDDDADQSFSFGYGRGYPSRESMNVGLFQIKRIANPQQKIVTRLRAFGSTKNMPYRYYNKAYNLSQALFPTNLQLPGTFLNYDKTTVWRRADDKASKVLENALRDEQYGLNPDTGLPWLRHVKGESNDAYIDKGDDAAVCPEGIREDFAVFDGSSNDLPEIYPTIVEATFGDLRGANVPDQSGATGTEAFQKNLQPDDERIDEILAVGHYDNNQRLIDDANIGDGILPEDGNIATGTSFDVDVPSKTLNWPDDFTLLGGVYTGPEETLFVIRNVAAGRYQLATMAATMYCLLYSPVKCTSGYILFIKQTSVRTGKTTILASYRRSITVFPQRRGEVELPSLPETDKNPQVSEIIVTGVSDIAVTIAPLISSIDSEGVPPSGTFLFHYEVGKSKYGDSDIVPTYRWFNADTGEYLSESFHVFVKDMGFDITACFTNDTPTLSMKSGRCVGREFTIGADVQKGVYQGKRGYILTLNRAKDEQLNTYYPSATDPIKAGDRFVLLNINMPDAYIRMAEVRLLRAATDYLADNCETTFTYQPSLDDIYLRRNYDRMKLAGTPEKSIFWRLYAGLKFTFRGIPEGGDKALPLIDISIQQVTIKMGEGLTPKVDLTLNDKVQQSTLQKITTSVDRIYNGSIFSNSGGSSSGASVAALLSLLQSEGSKMFLSKQNDDTANGAIIHKKPSVHSEGLQIGEQFVSGVGNWPAGRGGQIDRDAKGELFSLLVRSSLASTNYNKQRQTGFCAWLDDAGNAKFEIDETIVRNALHSEFFRPGGLNGEGWKLWTEGGMAHLEVDSLVVRQSMTVFELLIEKVRSTGGQIIVSPANGKIAEVVEEGDYYKITFEQANQFLEYDLVYCSTYTGKVKGYWAEVAAVGDNVIYIPKTEFDSAPEVGDDCVLRGNTSNVSRQNFISITASESGQPAIDIYDGVSQKNLSGCLRARIGYLSGIEDPSFGDNQPQGCGLYAANAYLKGRFILVNGEDVQTKFAVTEGRIQGVVEALREDLDDGSGYLNNPSFTNGLAYWTPNANSRKFFILDGELIMDAAANLLTDDGIGVSLTNGSDGRNSVLIPNGGALTQRNADLRSTPEITETDDGKKYAAPIYLNMVCKAVKAGTIVVEFVGEDKSTVEEYTSLQIIKDLAASDDFIQITGKGYWNGTGDFTIRAAEGLEVYVRAVVLTTDPIEGVAYKYKGFFDQSAKLTKLGNQALDADGKVIVESGLKTTASSAGLFVANANGTIGYMGVEQDPIDPSKTRIKLTGDDILLEGDITANGNVRINADGSIYAQEGRFKNCLLEGFVSGGVYTEWDSRIEEKQLHVKDKLTILCRNKTNVFLPTDPEYIGAKVTIVVSGTVLTDSGTGEISTTRYIQAIIRAGRSYYKHTYNTDRTHGDKTSISSDKNFDSIEGCKKAGLHGTEWFEAPQGVSVGYGSFMPNRIDMPPGIIELTGVAATTGGYITEQRYKINDNGTLSYEAGSNDPEELVGQTDKDATGDWVQLTQWAITNFRPVSDSVTWADVLKWENIDEERAEPTAEPMTTTTTTTTEPTQEP